MNTEFTPSKLANAIKMSISGIAILTIAACGTTSPKSDDAMVVRDKLTNLQSNSQLASRAPVEIKEAEVAVRAAEQAKINTDLAEHRILLADRSIDLAAARAQSRLLVDQRKGLSEERDKVRLDERTREARVAQSDAAQSRNEATKARNDAADARNDAVQARLDTNASERRAADLKAEIATLNAEATDRGLVVTLGDVLFSTDKSDLKPGTTSNLDKLVAFLIKYGDRTLVIEGHTDNTGEKGYNQSLSQRRADSVMNYLLSKGIASGRLSAYGKGEGSPISGNESATGRQLNRRVEVIISNTLASNS